MNKSLEFATMLFSIIGAIIMSFGFFEGFYFYFIANLIGIIFFYRVEMKYMLIMQAVFLIISINGLYNTVW